MRMRSLPRILLPNPPLVDLEVLARGGRSPVALPSLIKATGRPLLLRLCSSRPLHFHRRPLWLELQVALW